jgi:hypothetical protein
MRQSTKIGVWVKWQQPEPRPSRSPTLRADADPDLYDIIPERGTSQARHFRRDAVAKAGRMRCGCGACRRPLPMVPAFSPRDGRYAAFARIPRAEIRFGLSLAHPRYPAVPKSASVWRRSSSLPQCCRCCAARSRVGTISTLSTPTISVRRRQPPDAAVDHIVPALGGPRRQGGPATAGQCRFPAKGLAGPGLPGGPEHYRDRCDGRRYLAGWLQFPGLRVDLELDDGVALLVGDV